MTMPSTYDAWKLASPEDYERECCEDCGCLRGRCQCNADEAYDWDQDDELERERYGEENYGPED